MKSIKQIRIIVLHVLALATVSCSDLAKVREFAAIPAQPEVYQNLVSEYVQSSDRQKQYVDMERFPDIDKVTEARSKQTTGLLAMQKTLSSYMTMLGKLADDKVPQPGDSTTGIKSQLGSLSDDLKLSKAQITAFGKLLDITTRSALDGYRQKQLTSILQTHDKDVQVLLKQMQFVSGRCIKEAIGGEEAALSKRYQGVLRTIGDPNNPQYVQTSTTWYQKRQELLKKQAACGQYSQSLNKIAEGHSKLAAESGTVSHKDLSHMITSYKDEAKSLYDSARELLK